MNKRKIIIGIIAVVVILLALFAIKKGLDSGYVNIPQETVNTIEQASSEELVLITDSEEQDSTDEYIWEEDTTQAGEQSLEADTTEAYTQKETEKETQKETQKETRREETTQAQSTAPETVKETEGSGITVREDGQYSTKDEVALYIHTYGKLPSNFITKKAAKKLGWVSGRKNLWDVTDHMSIGGDRFGNMEGLLPEKDGRIYYECDINFKGKSRGAERIVFSNDGLIFYTGDHYETFEQLY